MIHLLSASVVRVNHSQARKHVENQVAGLMANLEMMHDEAMTTCSEKAYSLSTTPTPVYEIKKQCHFTLRDFVKYACRLAETSKSCMSPSSASSLRCAKGFRIRTTMFCPPHLRPGESMPPRYHGFLHHQEHGGRRS